jgi:hypothetical protein
MVALTLKEGTMDRNTFGSYPQRRHGGALMLLATLGLFAALAVATSGSVAAAGCSFCGKNLVLNPGAEAGKGLTATNVQGAVPHWTNAAGQFGAAAYTGFGVGWFTASSTGPKDKGKNYFFGGTTTAAINAKASIGTQTIKLPAGAAGHTATLSGWLGDYGSNTASVRAAFTDGSGKVLAGSIRIGPDTTIGGGSMAYRSRLGSVLAGAVSVTVTITFTDHTNANLAGADDISLVLS